MSPCNSLQSLRNREEDNEDTGVHRSSLRVMEAAVVAVKEVVCTASSTINNPVPPTTTYISLHCTSSTLLVDNG